jgi:hypothetical protein
MSHELNRIQTNLEAINALRSNKLVEVAFIGSHEIRLLTTTRNAEALKETLISILQVEIATCQERLASAKEML